MLIVIVIVVGIFLYNSVFSFKDKNKVALSQSNITPNFNNNTLTKDKITTTRLPACDAFLNDEWAKEHPDSFLAGRYILTAAGYDKPYAMFIDCYSADPEYNYGVFDRANNTYYYLGLYTQIEVEGAPVLLTDHSDFDSQLVSGEIGIATIQDSKTGKNKDVLLISAGDLDKAYQAILDLANITRKGDILIASKTPFYAKVIKYKN